METLVNIISWATSESSPALSGSYWPKEKGISVGYAIDWHGVRLADI